MRNTLVLLVLVSSAIVTNRTHASWVFSNRNDFWAALVGTPQTLDFERHPSGDLASSGGQLGGITIEYDFGDDVLMQIPAGQIAKRGRPDQRGVTQRVRQT